MPRGNTVSACPQQHHALALTPVARDVQPQMADTGGLQPYHPGLGAQAMADQFLHRPDALGMVFPGIQVDHAFQEREVIGQVCPGSG